MAYIEILYSLVAIVLILGIIPCVYQDNFCYRIICIFLIAFFITLVAQRPLLFRDTNTYIFSYNNVKWSNFRDCNLLAKDPVYDFEYGYLLLILILKSLGVSYQLFFALVALLFVVIATKWVKIYASDILQFSIESGYFFAIFLVLLYNYAIFYNFVAIRSCLSFSFLMWTSIRVKKKKYLSALVLFLCAFSIQRVSILGLVPIVISIFANVEISKQVFIVLWIILGISIVVQYKSTTLMVALGRPAQDFFNSFLNTKFEHGLYRKGTQALTRFLGFIGYWMNGTVYIFMYRKNEMYSKLTVIYLVCLFVCTVVCGYPNSYRIVDYFYYFSLPLNVALLVSIDKNWWKGRICILLTICPFLLMWCKYFIDWYRFD